VGIRVRLHLTCLILKCAAVAKEVDYYSPALYNYDNYDGSPESDVRWQKAAEYAFHACKQLDSINHTSKPIWPYITPGWTDMSAKQRYISCAQMYSRLTFLQNLGANGCILWLSSSAREEDSDESLILDASKGWLKASIDFAKHN